MENRWYIRAALFLFVVGGIAVLAWLTMPPEPDPCDNTQDVGAAVLADSPDDQEGLINRAIIVKRNCKEKQEDPDDQ